MNRLVIIVATFALLNVGLSSAWADCKGFDDESSANALIGTAEPGYKAWQSVSKFTCGSLSFQAAKYSYCVCRDKDLDTTTGKDICV